MTTNLPNYKSLETCTKNRLLAINVQIRSTRKMKASISDLVASRKQTDKLLAKVRHAYQRHPCDQEIFNALMTEYKEQILI